MATMRDVAALARVSAKTVSRVYNGDPHVTASTVGYVPLVTDSWPVVLVILAVLLFLAAGAVYATSSGRSPGRHASSPRPSRSSFRPEQAQDTLTPVEAGRDRLTGEGRGHDRQGEHPGGGDVDASPVTEVGDVGEGEADERQHGQHEGDEQLLAVTEDRRGLEAGLGEPTPARGGRRAHRRPPAVSTK